MRRQRGREEAAEGKRDREKGDWESERWRGGGPVKLSRFYQIG